MLQAPLCHEMVEMRPCLATGKKYFMAGHIKRKQGQHGIIGADRGGACHMQQLVKARRMMIA